MTADGRPRAVRLTPPQVELLSDLATHPIMYVRGYSRWGRTALVLARHGLAFVAEPDYSDHNQNGYKITDAGRAEAVRRGLIPAPSGDEAAPEAERLAGPLAQPLPAGPFPNDSPAG